MNILGCLDHPTEGEYYLDGEQVSNLRDNELADIRNRKVGYYFKILNILFPSNCITNVELPMRYAGIKQGRSQLAREALELVEGFGR